jgi:glucose-1-phosphate thymidylyltransferase
MNNNSITIIIPMAGWGTRVRPHTWSKPKPLVSVAGKTTLEHLLDMFSSLPDPDRSQFVFILSPYLGEMQIPAFIQEHYPKLKAHYVVQTEMKGQSHALWLAKDHLHGPLITCFADTLSDMDFNGINKEEADAVAWVKAIPDPRRFGVAVLDAQGWVKRFIEKPTTIENNLAVIGCYFFREAGQLLAAIDEQMKIKKMYKNEYFLTDAITLMIARGAHVRTQEVSTWLDTGTIDAILDTNRVLLEKNEFEITAKPGVFINQPVYIHPTAQIEQSTIGPYVSISANCILSKCIVTDSILEADCNIASIALKHSLIGRQVVVQGQGDDRVLSLNIGDNCTVLVS